MAVLASCHLTGMTPSQYDEIAPPQVEKLKTQLGFVIQAAFMDSGIVTVSEIWESREQLDRWFDENVKPNVPGVEQEWIIELHSLNMP
jgi:hypothetical protein